MGPRKLSAGTGWLIALVGAGIAAGVAFASVWASVAVVGFALFASTFLTRASRGAGVGMVFVANTVFTVLVALVIRSQADAAIADSIAQTGESGALVDSVGETAGTFAMILGAAAVSVPAFFLGLIGMLVGASARPKHAGL